MCAWCCASLRALGAEARPPRVCAGAPRRAAVRGSPVRTFPALTSVAGPSQRVLVCGRMATLMLLRVWWAGVGGMCQARRLFVGRSSNHAGDNTPSSSRALRRCQCPARLNRWAGAMAGCIGMRGLGRTHPWSTKVDVGVVSRARCKPCAGTFVVMPIWARVSLPTACDGAWGGQRPLP